MVFLSLNRIFPGMQDFNKDKGKTYVVHFKTHPHDVYIGRPSKWENPYTHKDITKTKAKFQVSTRQEAISSYNQYLYDSGLINEIEELRGKVLGCWCCKEPSDGSEKILVCHGQVIAKILNTPSQNKLL